MRHTWPNGRTFLSLARLPGLPTVWSNCLAGWLLSGGDTHSPGRLLWCGLGASCLYLGGTFLNDFFDVDFDRQQRSNRPIPAGLVARDVVGQLGILWLIAGGAILVLGARANLTLVFMLAVAVFVYNLIHKATELSPLLLGFCRFLLYLLAGATAPEGLAGISIWSGLAIGCYVAGLSWFARRQAIRGPIRRWPLILLAVPLGLAWISNANEHRHVAVALGLLLCLWIIPWLSHALREREPNIRMTVSGLVAGIVLVDLLAVGGHSTIVTLAFAALFMTVLLAQRYLPET